MNITFNNLLYGHTINDVDITHQQHLEILLIRVNALQTAYGKQLVVTSGYRDAADQQRINPKATHSRHLTGDAVDFKDSDGLLYVWAFANQNILAACGLWCELGTRGWLHCQSIPFGSFKDGGTRFFAP